MAKKMNFVASTLTLIMGNLTAAAQAGDCTPAAFPLGPVATVNRTDDAVSIYGVDLAYNDADDEFMFVWSGYNGNDNDVWGQRISVRKGYLGTTLEIANSSSSQTEASVVYNSVDNQYLTTWRHQGGAPGSPGFNNSFGRVINANGTPANGETRLYDAGMEVSLAFSPSRNEYALHGRNFAGDGGGAGIKAIKIGADGEALPPGTTIETAGAPAPAGQIIRNSVTGGFLSLWRDQVASNLRGRMLNADLSPVGAAFTVSAIFPGTGLCASAAFDPVAEQFLVAFGKFSGGPVYGQFVSGSGSPVGSEFLIHDTSNTTGAFVEYNPTSETFLVGWIDFSVGTLEAQLLAADGSRAGGRIVIANDGVRYQPRIEADPLTGGFLVAWSGTHPSKGTGPMVMTRVVDVRRGADWAAPFGVVNLKDAKLFRRAFNAGLSVADLVAPFGVVDGADRAAFIALYQACQ